MGDLPSRIFLDCPFQPVVHSLPAVGSDLLPPVLVRLVTCHNDPLHWDELAIKLLNLRLHFTEE